MLIILIFFAKNFMLLDHLVSEKSEKSILAPPDAWLI